MAQLLILGLGIFLATIISNINYSSIKSAAVPIYISVCGLVCAVSFFGTRVNGARLWLKLAGFTLQPTELLKLALILMIGFYLEARVKPDTRNTREYNLLDLIIPLTLTLIPTIFILKQPDLGSAIICLVITGAILFFMGIEKRTLTTLIICISIAGYAGWGHLKPYQKDRLVNFIVSSSDYTDKNWQANQSLVAFGSGGWFGRGVLRGPETQLGYLPEQETDFAFAALAEEHGFIFVAGVLLLLNFIVIKLLAVARNARDRFSAVVAIGVAFWLFSQSVINAGMVSGILPIVGVPMPIISYGGSSLFSILLAIGILSNIDHRQRII